MRDHQGLVISSFRGTHDTGEDDTVPVGFFRTSQNVRFLTGGVTTRFGSEKTLTIATVRRVAVYKRIGEAQRLLILNGSGELFDSTDLVNPILSIATMTDFAMVSIFNRAYITPHDGVTGLPGEKVYVYEGSGVARAAGGAGPTDLLTAVESAASGDIEAGVHIFAVAFETNTGFITPPGGYVALASTGGKGVDIGNIEVGGSNVVARHILATKIITDFTGDFSNQTYFFAVRIPNNTDTTVSGSFFDADLVSDASYLLESLSEIPAGVGIDSYRGRMIVYGENENTATVRVSDAGEPESFNAVEGFVTANPGQGGGLRNCFEYRNQLVLLKSQQAYLTQDNGSSPAYWEVVSLDMSVGTECHGVGRSLDFGENISDIVFVADRSGLKIFTGVFSSASLTDNIKDIWDRINQAYFNSVEVVIDPIQKHIFVAVPLDIETTPNVILFADYSEGLGLDTIRWTTWAFPYAPRTIFVNLVSNVSFFGFGSLTGNIYQIDPTELLDDNQAIDNWVEFPFIPTGNVDDIIQNFTGIKMRIKGAGNLILTVSGLDAVETQILQQPTLSATPGKPVFVGFNFNSERCSVKLRLTDASSYFNLTKFVIYLTPIWGDRPNG